MDAREVVVAKSISSKFVAAFTILVMVQVAIFIGHSLMRYDTVSREIRGSVPVPTGGDKVRFSASYARQGQ